jgi:phosphoglucosamine mutase
LRFAGFGFKILAMRKKYFGTDGIRGQANRFPMTPEIAMKAAMATAYVLQTRRDGAETNRVIVGKDPRLSGYMFEYAICAGFVAMGLDVIQVGPIPTPGIAMLTKSMRADVGVMISASHNSFKDNGIKFFGPDGYKLDDAIEAEIEALIEEDFTDKLAPPDGCGKGKRLDDALGRYVEHVKRSFPRAQKSLEGMKVVVDCANGAAYKVAPQILWELEAEVIAIGVTPDGRNINAGVGATATDRLQATVLASGADVGIALDGDADRLIVVDEKGKRVDGDQLMAALAVNLKERKRLAQDTLVATVMSNLGLEHFLRDKEINLVRTQVGDRYVMEAMREHGYTLGGEQSGHIVMSEFGTTGDGLMAALQVLAILNATDEPASEALHMFEPYPQILKNVKYAGAMPLGQQSVQDAIARAEQSLATQGRVLVRASGTEPLIRVMAEGQDLQLVEKTVDDICAVIANAAA